MPCFKETTKAMLGFFVMFNLLQHFYFDKVTLTLQNVTPTSHKSCHHNNKCNYSKTNGYK